MVALTRIYALLHEYPTLVREIATPTLSSFATACLQLIKPSTPTKGSKVPMSLVATVVGALSVVVSLYPTTLRPFGTQIRTALRSYLAPTSSDGGIVPQPLSDSSRRVVVLLHFTAPKNGNADEWAKVLDGFVRDAHATADQVFRAVQESWESSSGISHSEVSYEGEPQGGGDTSGDLPPWTGLQSGAQRLVGLLDIIATFFRCPTKTSVAIPMGSVADLVARLSLVLPPSSPTRPQEYSMEANPSIGREEREELWSVLPDIHLAVVHLCSALATRLAGHLTPLAPELLDQIVRAFKASHDLPEMRDTSYNLFRALVELIGPSLARITVDSLDSIIQVCCLDLLGAAGHQPGAPANGTAPPNQGSKNAKQATSMNADLFLPSGRGTIASPAATQLSASHRSSAEQLLVSYLTHVPQQHVKKATRALIDRTAVLTSSKAAMLAGVLHPYVDRAGRRFATTLPFLAQAFPHDADVEVLRSSLRTHPYYFGDGPGSRDTEDDAAAGANDEGVSGEALGRGWASRVEVVEPSTSVENGILPGSSARSFGFVPDDSENPNTGALGVGGSTKTLDKWETPSLSFGTAAFEPLAHKRKSEEEPTSPPPKRVDKGKAPEVAVVPEVVMAEGEDGSDSDESVHLQAVLEDEDEDGEDGEDDDGEDDDGEEDDDDENNEVVDS